MVTFLKLIRRSGVLAIAVIMSFAVLSTVSAEPHGQPVDSSPVPSVKNEHRPQKAGHMFMDLSKFLKLEPQVLKDKLKTSTLADIAKEQGIAREAMKAKLIELLKARVSSHPQKLGEGMDYSAVADKLLDAKGGWHQHRSPYRHGKLISDREELAKLLKTTPEELKQSLHSGKSLAQIAKERDVPVQAVIDQQVQAITKRLDRKLSEGKLTKEEYAERKSRIAPFVSDVVNGKLQPMKHTR
ncbi:hypothetical protein AM231_12285 [Paenibacillus solani]|uniref:SHOCT domain-containing protein n=1 Tax=Paenibacillus solani TaxID=1705565 RepID=A0A0M1P5S0_9BACL|nr:hypothetical protein AM231_12285 [Paenibacillus solani]